MPHPIVRPFIAFGGERYFRTDDGYYRLSRSRGRRLLHRDVWTAAHGPIPDGHHIHHIDGDRSNNDLANLECIEAGEHLRRHKLGSTHSVEARARITEANRRRWQQRKPRPVVCAECGDTFHSTGTRAKFCSRRCAKRDEHRRTYEPGKGYRRADGTHRPRP